MTAHDMTGHDLAWQDATAHDMTVHFLMRFQSGTLHDMTTAARIGRGRGQRRKKKAELYTIMLPEVTNTYSSPCSPICMQG